MDNNEIDSMYEELLKIEEIFIKSDLIIEPTEDGKVHLEGTPLYDEYYGARVFNELSDEFDEREEKSALKDPDGGLTAAGREFFKRTEGANLKPGVKGPADTPEKMRRKGSFLTRFFTNPSGPMVDEKGRATRLALSATAWGERVPKNAEDAAALAAKGRRLLERYENSKKKSEEFDELEVKAGGSALGQSIGQRAGGAPPPGSNPEDEIDRDGDGTVFDGTENEQAKPKKQREPYKKLSNSFLEKRRRQEVRRELARRGITPTRMGRIVPEEDGKGQIQNQIYDRPENERDARAESRAKFTQDEDRKRFVRNQLKKQGITANAKKEDRDEKERAARRAARAEYDRRVRAGEPKKPATSSQPPKKPNPKPNPPYPKGYEPGKPADRYPDPEKKYPPGQKPSPSKPRDQKPADRYPDPEKKYPPGQKPSPTNPRDQKPADRYPEPGKKYPPGQKPSPRDQKPADRYPSPEKKYPPGQKPSTLEERDRNMGPSRKPSTLEERDKNRGPSGPISPKRQSGPNFRSY